MKIKKIILTATAVLSLSVCAMQPTITVSAASANAAIQQPGDTASPQHDCTRWIYKLENGKYYKRLYNSSTGVWIGDWIFVRNA